MSLATCCRTPPVAGNITLHPHSASNIHQPPRWPNGNLFACHPAVRFFLAYKRTRTSTRSIRKPVSAPKNTSDRNTYFANQCYFLKSFANMKSMLLNAVLVLFLLAEFSAAELDHDKNRRGANMGLYAFPRVGRDGLEAGVLDGIYGDASQEDYNEADFQKRASGLVAFPRVGRGDSELRKLAHLLALQQVLDKRTGPSASSGLWFGPRLGKRSVDAKSFADTAKGQKEFN
ncbi:cardio acceleratory peptide 2b [Drosophila eugracilis]|uniref:cardio acceleratory peptide 2b n=1 Tax=Drosophila eugracilis TaxID=29029 RepID=UPI001BDAB130|nr:cardio acceleratory peptide 2b [Drosophila eugracilis]